MQRAVWLAVIAAALAAGAFVALRPAQRPRNVILISIDTLRQDRVGAYGYERPTTPSLDALAARGVVFEDATAPSSWTVPSHVSLFTGLEPHSHGVTGRFQRVSDLTVPIPVWLQQAGFDTAAFVNSVLLDGRRGFARGFDHFERVMHPTSGSPAAPEIHRLALRWLDRPHERPFFLFLHYYDIHTDYTPAEEYRRLFVRPYDGVATGAVGQLVRARADELELGPKDAQHLSDLYDAEIRQLDDAIGRFFAELERRGLLAETAVIVTSDHGEEFLEHGGFLHGRTLHGELVRVPLVLAGPGIPRGRRVAGPASLIDVLPMLAGLLGREPPSALDGVDISHTWGWRGRLPRERTLFFDTNWWLGHSEGDWKRAVQRWPWKLHYARSEDRFSLYDLEHDPGENEDLSAREPEKLAELRQILAPRLEAGVSAETREDVTPQEIEQLRALGYVEGAP